MLPPAPSWIGTGAALFSSKPPACQGCVLHHSGTGFAPPAGPPSSPLAFLGEALGREEAFKGEPFIGAAGQLFNRALRALHMERSEQHVLNVVNCQPPGNELDGAHYGPQAIAHCNQAHVQPALSRWLASQTPSTSGQLPVLVTLGGVPLRTTLGLTHGSAHSGGGGGRVQDFHGTVHLHSSGKFWVVPTYHPAHIVRGAFNLLSVLKYDLAVANEVMRGEYTPDPIEAILDPPIEWFSQWADNYLAAAAQDPDIWLAVDIETPDKAKKLDEGELTTKDRDFHILRVNLSCNRSEGLTVPFSGAYITILRRILASLAPKIFWNWRYDVPRLIASETPISGPIYDAMEMWHKLNSDLPRGLGFVAPFYSHYGAWKHLAGSEPVLYAAIDGPQTLRCAYGIAAELSQSGMWEVPFLRHVHMLDNYVLQEMEAVGLPINKDELLKLKVVLQAKREEMDTRLQGIFPDELKPRVPKAGLSKHPRLEDGTPEPAIEEKHEKRVVRYCHTCGEGEVPVKHRCKNEDGKVAKDLTARVEMQELLVSRFYRKEEFSPGSWQQVLAYILHQKHKPGKNKKTKKPTTDKQTIERLARTTRDPFYRTLLERRACSKVESTYVDGSLNRLAGDPRSIADGRLHPTTTHKPSTQRLSMMAPNLQNVIARGEHGSYAVLYRRTIEAGCDCDLIEADFSGIEAVNTGWFMGDPDYIRWARRGIHALVTAHLLAQKGRILHSDIPSLDWPEEEITKVLKALKKKYDQEYNQCKRCVHGKNYGLTVRGMVLQFPDEFPTTRAAQEIEEIYYRVAPGLPRWQNQVRELASRQNYLGGPGAHPYGYKHWFFNVLSYKAVPAGAHTSDYPIVQMGGRNFFVMQGDDAKRCVAFFPQSTAAGTIKECMLRLFADKDSPSYLGDVYYGKTPLRAPIHDSLLLEVPKAQRDRVVEILVREMTRPIAELPCPVEWNLGSHLSIGVEVKAGRNWAAYNDDAGADGQRIINLEGMKGVELTSAVAGLAGGHGSLAADAIVPLDEYDEDLDADDLQDLKERREATA